MAEYSTGGIFDLPGITRCDYVAPANAFVRGLQSCRNYTSEPENPQMSSHTSHSAPKKKKVHQDWRIIVAAVVMMIAMILYVLTMDETVVLDPMKPAAPADAPSNP